MDSDQTSKTTPVVYSKALALVLSFLLSTLTTLKCLEVLQASLYANDTQITITSDEIGKLLLDAQQELSNLSEWMKINKLSPNPTKTEYMTIGHPRRISN